MITCHSCADWRISHFMPARYGRILRPYFSTPKKRMKPWPKRKDGRVSKNPILRLLAPQNGSFRGLAKRTGMSATYCWDICAKRRIPSLKAARLLARALGVSTDTFADVLEVYAVKRERKPKSKS